MITSTSIPTKLQGSIEYLAAEVEVTTPDVELDTQAVSIHFNGTEYPAVWYGDVGATRRCRTTSAIVWSTIDPGVYSIQVEVTDSPEIPLIPAGYISVQAP